MQSLVIIRNYVFACHFVLDTFIELLNIILSFLRLTGNEPQPAGLRDGQTEIAVHQPKLPGAGHARVQHFQGEAVPVSTLPLRHRPEEQP